jgi:hypothetical protein
MYTAERKGIRHQRHLNKARVRTAKVPTDAQDKLEVVGFF